MLQVTEYETLQVASDGACPPCLDGLLGAGNDGHMKVFTPQQPDARILDGLRLRCGANVTCPTREAVFRVRIFSDLYCFLR